MDHLYRYIYIYHTSSDMVGRMVVRGGKLKLVPDKNKLH